jgi:hypothetical protein
MSKQIQESTRFLPGVYNADISTARTGPWYQITDASRIMAGVLTGALVGADVVTVRVMKATNGSGAGSTVAAEETFTAATTAAQAVTAEIQTDLLGAGFTHVAVQILCTEARAGTGFLALGGLRYGA